MLFPVVQHLSEAVQVDSLGIRLLDLISNSCTINLPTCFVPVQRLIRNNKNDMMCSKLISTSKDLHVDTASWPQRVPVQGFCVWQNLPSLPWSVPENLQPEEKFSFENFTGAHHARVSIYWDKQLNVFSGFSMAIHFVCVENMLFATGWTEENSIQAC